MAFDLISKDDIQEAIAIELLSKTAFVPNVITFPPNEYVLLTATSCYSNREVEALIKASAKMIIAHLQHWKSKS